MLKCCIHNAELYRKHKELLPTIASEANGVKPRPENQQGDTIVDPQHKVTATPPQKQRPKTAPPTPAKLRSAQIQHFNIRRMLC